MSNENQQPIKIVIAGGGIIGICTAYYLTFYQEYCKEENKGQIPKFDITIIERRSVACSASGYAGGFMARDWCEGERSDPLVRQSYKLHQDLAQKFNGKENYDFRQVETLEFIADEGKEEEKIEKEGKKTEEIKTPPWVEAKISCKNVIGEIDATAQMQPMKFCHYFLEKLKAQGVKLRIAEITNVKYNDDSKVYEGVYVKDQTYDNEGQNITKDDVKEEFIPSDILILALGPWTFQANRWFPNQMPKGFTGHKCQSYLVRPKKPLSDPQVYFIPIEKDGDPVVEIYPRPDGTVYICSMAAPEPFPRDEIEKLPFVSPTDQFYLERQQKLVKALSEHGLNDSELLEVHEATYLPVPPKSYLPIIGKLKEIKGKEESVPSSGVYIASGHNYWGIMTATGTGLALAELIILGKSEQIDIRGLNPLRPGHEDEDEEIFDW
ncbi:FAD dependent oxidoreductase [Piromyces finnis]|uniref:FAD dependent oxidoreductase n=1 Tax=Piromyces finnis TaxID=1754191 RepID=A0A1Y1VCR1_9FUNG|nr:FAD dependent oxidoreductase [Piromyces finnis]|eukprot:ORX51439.1 FAD dependent oxidoreductase [Piromyces finnis]